MFLFLLTGNKYDDDDDDDDALSVRPGFCLMTLCFL